MRSPLERMPHGYTNLTTRDGPVVRKCYQCPFTKVITTAST